MKKIITIACVLCALLSFSQQITLKKGKFYLKENQISSFETKRLLATNLKALGLYKEAKSKEALGGFLLGFGIALTATDLGIGLFSDKKYPSALTYAGLGAIAVSIPVLSGRKDKIAEAIELYNKDKSTLGATNTPFELNAISNQNGFGFQLKF